MMSDLYILKNKTPVKVDDVLEWGKSRREIAHKKGPDAATDKNPRRRCTQDPRRPE